MSLQSLHVIAYAHAVIAVVASSCKFATGGSSHASQTSFSKAYTLHEFSQLICTKHRAGGVHIHSERGDEVTCLEGPGSLALHIRKPYRFKTNRWYHDSKELHGLRHFGNSGAGNPGKGGTHELQSNSTVLVHSACFLLLLIITLQAHHRALLVHAIPSHTHAIPCAVDMAWAWAWAWHGMA
jgi:hypothetical protein